MIHLVVHARRTDELRDDDALSAVDDKGAAGSHQREVTHVDVAFLDLTGRLVEQARLYSERRRIGGVAHLTFNDAVVGVIDVEMIVDKIEDKVVLIIGNARDIPEYFLETFFEEPAVGSLLNLNKIRHTDDFIDFAEAHALGTAQLDGFDIYHKRIHSFVFISRKQGALKPQNNTGQKCHENSLDR